MKPIVVHAAARAELDQATRFYESRARGLGLDLLKKVGDAFAEIQRNPSRWPQFEDTGLRKYLIRRFPFAIYYLERSTCLWVIAVAHGKRRPRYWRKRAGEV